MNKNKHIPVFNVIQGHIATILILRLMSSPMVICTITLTPPNTHRSRPPYLTTWMSIKDSFLNGENDIWIKDISLLHDQEILSGKAPEFVKISRIFLEPNIFSCRMLVCPP